MASDDDDFGKVSFMNSKTGWVGHEAGWVGIKKLGEGGQGCAGLWVKRDPVTQTIIDRVVIKETAMYNWNNWNAWAGKDNKIPSEVYISQLMRKNYNTVQIFAHRVWGTPHFTYRAYMEYCALGDLATIDELYRQKQLRIPEPFLWRLFEDLARAAIAMENPAKAGEKIGPGSFVAHMDIKPGNIFMCPPDADYFPKYPEAKLGDFGGAWLSNPLDHTYSDIDRLYHSVHTPGYLPPEADNIMFGSNLKPPTREIFNYTLRARIAPSLPESGTSALNIWTIGVVLADLMADQKLRGSKFMHNAYTEREDWLADLFSREFVQINYYSKDLKQLVKDCVRFYPWDRPSASKLMARVKEGIANHAGPMVDKTCLDQTQYDGSLDLDDEYNMEDTTWVGKKVDEEEWDDLDTADDDDTPRPSSKSYSTSTGQGAFSYTSSTRFNVGTNATPSVRNFFAAHHAGTGGGFVAVRGPAVPFHADRISIGGLAGALADSMAAAGGAVVSRITAIRNRVAGVGRTGSVVPRITAIRNGVPVVGRTGLSSALDRARLHSGGVGKSVKRKK